MLYIEASFKAFVLEQPRLTFYDEDYDIALQLTFNVTNQTVMVNNTQVGVSNLGQFYMDLLSFFA